MYVCLCVCVCGCTVVLGHSTVLLCRGVTSLFRDIVELLGIEAFSA